MAEKEPAIEPAKPALSGRALVTWVVVALVVAGLASLYQHASRQYPYYFIWDMDLSTAIDTALINSGRTPDHINHTAFGMYLVSKHAARWGERLGLLSVADLDDVFRSLNPVACMAELTDYLRRLSPWVALAAVLCLWAAACLLFRLGPAAGAMALVLCASQESMLYHSTVVRTGLYSVFFWCAGLLALALAARRRREPYRLGWLFVGGVLLSLSYLTKLQAMVYVVIGTLIGFFFGRGRGEDEAASRKPRGRQAGLPNRRVHLTALALSGVNLIVFLILLAAAGEADIPVGKALFTHVFGMTKQAKLLLVLCAVLCGAQGLGAFWKNRTLARWLPLAARVTVLLSGGLAAFALHMLMFADASLSFDYLLWDFKILFLRPLYTDFKDLSFYIERFGKIVCFHPLLFATHLASLSLVGLSAFLRKRRDVRRRFWLCVVLSAMVLFNAMIGARFHHKDMIWYEPALVFLTIGYCATAFAEDFARRALRAATCLAVPAVLLTANIVHLGRVIPRIDSNLHAYGWQADRWLGNVYGDSHREYAERMYRHYVDEKTDSAKGVPGALRQAADHAEVRRIASFVFRNQAIGMPHIGVVWEQMPVWRNELSYRIAALPASLRGAMVVDASSAAMGRRGFLPEEEPQRFGEDLSAHAPDESNPSMAILPRPDLNVFLFLQEPDYDAAAHTTPKADPAKPPRIEVSDGGRTLTLYGLRLPKYTVIPASRITGRYFFVIRSSLGR